MSRRVRALSHRSFPWADLDPDRRNAILLIGGIGAVVLFALAIVGYGYYHDRIAPRHETVLKVGGREFDYATLERRVRADVVASASNDTQQLIGDTLLKMEQEEVTRRAAKGIGVKATDEEVQAELVAKLNLPADAPREQIATFLRFELVRSRLSLAELREIVAAGVLEKKMLVQFESIVPPRAEHANLSLIQTGSQVEAIQSKQKLDEGQSFAVTAAQVSIHRSKAQAGDVGWLPRGALDPKVEEFAFSELGVSDIIETDDGFFIVQVRGRETLPVTEEGKHQVAEFSLVSLLSKTKKDLGVDRLLNTAQLQRLAGSLGVSRA